MPRCLAVLALIALTLSSATGQESLADRIDAVVNGPDYKQAHWGVLVVDAKTGNTIYERNPDKLFTPASTTKLYSTAAALAALGPQFKFETPVYRRGQVTDGRLA